MIEVQNISVIANRRYLLRAVSLGLHPGELVAVVGPNGAGKSTLLKVLCGDVRPQAGEVLLEARPLSAWTALQQAQRRAVLPQESSLSFPFVAFEVTLMGRSPHTQGLTSLKDQRIAKEALERTGVFGLASRDYPTLSGGEKQRVQLSRVLAQIWEVLPSGHRYLFLDEPTNNLDLAHQHHTLQIAKQFACEGVAVLAVLHDLNLAAQYADKIVMLCKGSVVATGTPHEVLTEDTLCSVFETPVIVTKHPCFDCPLVVAALGDEVANPPNNQPREIAS